MAKRILALLLTLATMLSMLAVPTSAASTLEEAMREVDVFAKDEELLYLTMNGQIKGQHYTYYNYKSVQTGENKEIPAYCVDPRLYGVPSVVPEGTPVKYSADTPNTDPKIMGIIANGYPHMSLDSLGLSCKEEAYYATKTALWCYLLGTWSVSNLGVNPNLTGSDKAAAERVLKATKDIYTRGMYWEKLVEPKLTAVPDRDEAYPVTINGSQYYQQVFTLHTETWSYEPIRITLAPGAPAGTKVMDMSNNEITSMVVDTAGANGKGFEGNFKVVFPASSVEGQEGVAKVNLSTKVVQYQIFSAHTLEADKYGNIQDYMLDTDPFLPMEASAVARFSTEQTDETELQIIKLEEGTRIPLEGAVFDVFSPHGDRVGRFSTDANGKIRIPLVITGNYTVTEVSAPEYHLLPTENTHNITVEHGKTATLTVTNAPYGSLRVIKRSDMGEGLAGVAIEIKNITTGETRTGRTGLGGSVEFTELAVGAWQVRETAGISGYVVDTTSIQNVSVVAGECSTATITNKEKPGLRIVKYDSQTMRTLPDITFKVFRDTELIGEYVTDQLGDIVLRDIEPGVYLVQEIATDPSHVINSTPQEVKIDAGDGIVELVFLNDVKPGIRLKKVDSVSYAPQANALFRIAQVGGTFSEEYYTDTQGEIDLKDLEPGSYVVTELQAPDGYLIDDATRTIRIDPNENAVFVFTNTRKPVFRLTKLDSKDSSPISGASFRVSKIEDGSHYLDRVTGTDGTFTIEGLEPGVYSVQEIEVPDRFVVNPHEYHVELFPGQVSDLVVTNDEKPNLKIMKRDAVTGEPVPNTTFTLKKVDGSTLTTEPTDANGEVLITKLDPGVYEIIEKSVPDEYLLSEERQLITLVPNRTATAIFFDYQKPSLTVNKVDSITGDGLKNVKFRVIYASNNTFTGEINDLGIYTTDENGQFKLTKLRDGWYRVTELEPPKGYSIKDSATQDCYIEAGRSKALTFENVPLSAIIIKKVSNDGHPLQGAWFRLRYLGGSTSGAGGTIIGEYETSSNGTITVTALKAGTYIAEEISAPDGYVLGDDNIKTVYLSGEDQDVVTICFGNAAKSSVLIKKISLSDLKPLSDVEFLVTFSDGAVVGNGNGHFTTDAAGTILIDGLDPDVTIVAKELRAKAGYVLDNVPQTIKTKSGETVTMEFRNAPKGSLTIYKKSTTGEPLSGAEFKVTTADGRLVANNGGRVSSNGIYVTDGNGMIVLTDLEPNTYVVTETKAPAGHVLASSPQTVVVTADDAQTVTFTDGAKGSLTIVKKDAATGEFLKGVEFKVTTADGKVVANDEGRVSSNGFYYTDENGQINITGLDPNTYIVTETKAIDGYVLNDTPVSVVVDADDHQTVVVTNAKRGSLVILKKDSVTGKPLEGVTFKITTSKGTFVANQGGKLSSNGIFKTDKNGQIIISDLAPDTYVVTELETIPGYIIDENTRSQTVAVDTNDTQTLTFYNIPTGGLLVVKVDQDDGSRLKGAKMEIRKMNGEIIGTYTTDENGVINIPEADSGWYIVTELKAPKGYKLDSTPHQVEVKDGQTGRIEVENEKISGISIHKTDSVTGEGIYDVKFIVYDSGMHPAEQLVTDQNGYAYTETELSAGKYFVRELEAADGYLLDTQYKTIMVVAGKIATIEWKNTPVTGQIQITKYAADDNTVTGQASGQTLQGAVFEIVRERSGKVVGYITTDARGVAASSPLPLGRYIITEVSAPAYYKVSSEKFDVTLEYPGQIIKLAAYDKPAKLNVTITKTGVKEVLAGSKMTYHFTVANGSNVPLENFFWHDKLPYDVSAASGLTTGTYSVRLTYRILYKTNYNDYRVLASNLLSTNNYGFQLNALPLQAGEVVTDVYFDFGTVPAGFQSTAKPSLTVSVSPDATDGYYVTNRADAGGKYGGTWETANASWLTIVRNLTPPQKTPLPKTGY